MTADLETPEAAWDRDCRQSATSFDFLDLLFDPRASCWISADLGSVRTAIAIRACHTAAAVYPALLLAAFNGTWLLAWLLMGHRPRASLDDPKDVAGLVYVATGLVLVALPVAATAALASVALRFITAPSFRWSAVAWGVVVISAWVLVWGLVQLDPLGVVNWWFD